MLLPILVASLVQLAAAEPLLAYSAPKAFLGLEQDTFKLNNGVIAFLPGFHACGTLQLISVDGLQHGDFAFLPSRNETAADLGDQTGSGLKEAYEGAETKDLEQNAREGEVVAWAKGWARSCGKGAAMKEVRAAKVEVDWGEDRKESVRKLGECLAAQPIRLTDTPSDRLGCRTLPLGVATSSPSTPSHHLQLQLCYVHDLARRCRLDHSPLSTLDALG